MLMRSRTAALLPAALLLLTACSAERGCTTAGASDVVRVDLRSVPLRGEVGPVVAELCLDNVCRPRQPLVGSQAFFAGGEDFLSQKPTRVQVKVFSADRLVRRAAANVQPEEYAPNGKACAPVVSQARLAFGADNALRQVGFSEK